MWRKIRMNGAVMEKAMQEGSIPYDNTSRRGHSALNKASVPDHRAGGRME